MDLDFSVISRELHPLLKALPIRIKREWPASVSADEGLQLLFHGIAALAANTYHTVLWAVAEKPAYPERRVEFVLAISPMVRTILEQVMTVCFISEDLQKRVEWYYKATWLQIHERRRKEVERYGEDPRWKDRLQSLTQSLDALGALAKVTEEEKSSPKEKIKYWLNPGKMKKRSTTTDIKRFLQFLEDWYYRELSQQSHLSGTGLIELAPVLILEIEEQERRQVLEMQRSHAVLTTVTLSVALLSEIQGILRFDDLSHKLNYLWGILGEFWRDPSELFEMRYRQLLAR